MGHLTLVLSSPLSLISLFVSIFADCHFEVRIGFFPGKKLELVRQEIEQAVEAAAKAKDINYSLKWRGFQAEGCVMDPKVKSHLVFTVASRPH